MTWIIVRGDAAHPYRYFRTGKGLENWASRQHEAMRFTSRKAAKRGMWKWEKCYLSSWPPRVVKLVPSLDYHHNRATRALRRNNEMIAACVRTLEQLSELLRKTVLSPSNPPETK